MIVSLGKRRAMLSSVVTRMRSTLTSVGVIGIRPHHDPGVEQQDHAVLLRALVDRRVALVVVALQRTCQFAQPAKSCVVELVDERNGLRIVEPDRAQPDESLRMLFHRGEHVRDILGLRQDEARFRRTDRAAAPFSPGMPCRRCSGRGRPRVRAGLPAPKAHGSQDRKQ